MRISDWSSDVCSSDLCSFLQWQRQLRFAPGPNRAKFAGERRRPCAHIHRSAVRKYRPLFESTAQTASEESGPARDVLIMSRGSCWPEVLFLLFLGIT